MLYVHRAERSDRLIAGLADVLAEPLDDPLETEIISVYSRGIERWIAQELSQRLGTGDRGADGVCANVAFPFPGGLIRSAIAKGSGVDPERDPWLPTRLTWPLLEIADEHAGDPSIGPLQTHVGSDDPDRLARRLGAVRHLADLFDRYSVERPDMILRWAEGEAVGPDGGWLDERHAWQAYLWKLVHDHLSETVDIVSFAERYASARRALADDPSLVDLPPRLSLFGLTALPKTFLATLETLALHRHVHIFLQHPSPALWKQVAGAIPDSSVDARTLPRREADPTADIASHPLLRAWGRDVRELQLVVPSNGTDLHHDTEPADPTTLLTRLQADIRSDRPLGAASLHADRPALVAADRSVQVHDCHGRLRQVEVLRDAVLHLLAEDPTLEPRDVIVMCPDIERFAPLITAVFGAEAVAHDGTTLTRADDEPPALRVRLADRSLRRTNPVLEVVTLVLELVDGRVTASSVLDLLSREPVARRFRLDDDALDLIESWVTDLQIRWGIDAEHRTRHGLPAIDAHSWRAGLERLLLGAAMADEDLRYLRRATAPTAAELIDPVVPFDDVEGGDTDLAGRLVEAVSRLARAIDRMAGTRTIAEWRDVVSDAADALTLTDSDTSWQRAQLHRILEEFVEEATVGDSESEVQLTLAEVRAMLDDRLAGRPSRTSHRTGDLTVSTLVPMRSVPHRVVCLLGLDDGAFPRQVVPDSDDVLLEGPRVGDRDARSEDRQLLLDALMSATDTLLITYAGRNPRTNEPRPPAVPVDELLDVVDRTVTSPSGEGRARDVITIKHPLAEHDHRNVTPGALRPDGRPWSFHVATLDAAVARRGDKQAPPEFLADELAPLDRDVIELDDLISFLEHPAKAFVRQRLELTLPGTEDRHSDAIPSSLDGLGSWRIGEDVLEEWLRGGDTRRTFQVLRARGFVPPGALADPDVDQLRRRVMAIQKAARSAGIEPGERHAEEIDVTLPDGRVLRGTVPDVRDGKVQRLTYSRVKAKHRLAAYARWLALLANQPDKPWTSAVVGRSSWKKRDTATYTIAKVRSDDPAATVTSLLMRLIDLYDRGMRSPIPLYCETSAKIADNLDQPDRRGERDFVQYEWETNHYKGIQSEDVDPYHQLVLGGVPSVDDLFAEPCRGADETGWSPSTSRVSAYAWRLWQPVLTHEDGRHR